jgi:hypothetical protein
MFFFRSIRDLELNHDDAIQKKHVFSYFINDGVADFSCSFYIYNLRMGEKVLKEE